MDIGTTENPASSATPSTTSSAPTSTPSSTSPASSSGSTPAPSASATTTPSVGSALESLERIAAKDAALASSPNAPGTPADGQATNPNAPAKSGAAAPAVPPPSGEAPEARIQAATRNARDQATREVREQYSWTRGLDAQNGQRAIANHMRIEADPAKFFMDLGRELGFIGADGNFVQNLDAGDESNDLIDPEPDLRSPDGKVTGYSASASDQRINNAVERLRRELRGELQPFQDERAAREVAEQEAAIRSEGRSIAQEILAVAETYPHFKEHKREIGERLASIDPSIRARIGSPAAFLMAYNAVMAEKVLPNLSASAASASVADMNRSAAAGAATIGPNVGTVTKTVVRDGDLTGLAKRMAEIEAGLPQ